MKVAKSTGRKISWGWTEEIGFFLLNYTVFCLHANEQHHSPFRQTLFFLHVNLGSRFSWCIVRCSKDRKLYIDVI